MILNLVQESRRIASLNGVSNKTLIFLIENFGALAAFRSVTGTMAKNAVNEYYQLLDDKWYKDNPNYEGEEVDEYNNSMSSSNADYLQGQRDVETWREDRQLFGHAYADQMQLNREFNEY